MIIFCWYSRTLSLLERILKKKKDFTEEEFLHKKINNKGVYVYYGVTEDIPEDACSLRQLWKFDSIKLK